MDKGKWFLLNSLYMYNVSYKLRLIFLQTGMLYRGGGGEILGLFLTKKWLETSPVPCIAFWFVCGHAEHVGFFNGLQLARSTSSCELLLEGMNEKKVFLFFLLSKR